MKKGIKSLFHLLDKKGKRQICLSGFLAILSAAFSVMPMLGLYVILDVILSGGEHKDAAAGATIAVVGIFLQVVFHMISTRLSHHTAFDTLHVIRSRALKKLSEINQGYLDENPAGKLKSILFDDVEQLEMFYGHHFPEILGSLSIPLIMIVVVLFFDLRIALALLVSIGIFLLCLRAIGRLQIKNFPIMLRVSQALNSSMVEYINGIKEIRIFSMENETYSRFEKAADEYRDFMVKWFKDSRHNMSINTVVMSSSIVFVFPVAGYLYIHGEFEISALLLYIFIALCFAAPLSKIAIYTDMLHINTQIAQRVNELLSLPELAKPTIKNVPQTFDVTFNQVDFGYGEENVLNQLSFTAKQNTITAFTGPSGGGKSTIAKLIARFWDVKNGSIRIGNIDVREMTQEQLAAIVSFVTQNIMIFDMTVAENICLGKPEAGMEEIIQAAKEARCHEFIMALPDGYNTRLNRALPLSGGERQRISIARAFLKNAPVLILDEATAYCDPDNEDELQRAVSALTKGKTVLVIAHRLSSIVEADQILFIKNGTIAASGTHAELLLQSQAYQSMWEAFNRSEKWFAGRSESYV